ncbi:hypothetical protein PVAG01_04511 [Phlyctema vagabunda]|uniref:Uncharacterized protein n=1 Tax=Phlyctema vagabunda TaxID=108571 RepID=A0ABR4PPC4_9HELO
MSDGTVERAPQITFRQYMTVAFLPLILAVVFTFPWRILDTTIREMEPYYQLQNPEGVNAKNSILLDYTTSYFITTPFKSIYRRHYYVFSSALISIAVLIIAPLSSEALFVSLSGDCGINKSGPCHATWGIYPTLARAMEAILAFISLLVLAMMILNSRRHSGVYANPLSIAGLGTLFQNPATLGEFSSINSRVGDDGLKAILAQRKYNLSSMKDSSETSYYGIINISAKEDIDSLSTFGGDVRGKYSVVNSTEELRTSSGFRIKNSSKGRNDRWAWMLETLLHSSAFLLIAGLLALVTYYHWTSGDTGFERFMDSQEFGVKFLMTVVGVIIKLFWANIDEDLRRTEPYRRLLEGSAKPEDSILVYTYMSPISALASSLVRRHYLTSLISFVALLSEILPIALANIPFSPAATREAYSVCTYIAMAVLAIMILTLVLFVIFRHTRARHLHHLPRQPVTIASTLVYLATETRDHRGSMIESLAGLVFVGAKERDTMVRAMGRRYGMGRIGEADLRIDDEDRISRY